MNHFLTSIDEAVQSITTWFKTCYSGPEGFPVYDVDGDTGNPVSTRHLLCEFDDYAPFFWILGEKTYILEQFQQLADKLHPNRLLFDRPQIRARKGLGLPGPLRRFRYADSQDYVEILYGLSELFTLSQNPVFLEAAEKVFETVTSNFMRRNTIRSFRLMPMGPALPFADAMSGMFIEIACDLASLSPDSARKTQYRDYAINWMETWVNCPMFRKHGVFPSVRFESPWDAVPFLRTKQNAAVLAKPNASMAYGLLSLAAPPFSLDSALSAFDRWIEGLKNHFTTSTGALSHVPRFSMADPAGPVLSTNFAILDILCDATYFLENRSYLDMASAIARFFLLHQSAETGLIPDEPGEDRSYLDANADFAVSLVKLAELTGKDSYHDAGRKILSGILKYHRGPYGYYRDVHLHTGKPIRSLVETRFCSLLLKPLILYRNRLTIYGENGQWSIFRDR